MLYKSVACLALLGAADAAFTGGAAKKAPPKKAVGKTTNTGFFGSSVAPKKAPKNSKAAISTARASQQLIDVTGGAYEQFDASVPKFDEIGVLPPLGRWDPLQIREQVRAYMIHIRRRQRRALTGACANQPHGC